MGLRGVPVRGRNDPSIFSSARSFPTAIGPAIRPGEIGGYYFDLRFKAETPRWPPDWLQPRERQLHTATAQWGLGAYERYLAGEGDEWLAASIECGSYLIDHQETVGDHDGAWLHLTPIRHSYFLPAPWVSAMAQGEAASLLVRLYTVTGEQRFGDAASRAMKPLRLPISRGGVRAQLSGGPFFEEYPTSPPSFVLNGGIFALWGVYDVATGLADPEARRDFEGGLETLAENIHRYDNGYWSLYDLFPHPLPNIASGAYHALHTAQLRAMQRIAPRPEIEETLSRFEGYAKSRTNLVRAFARKVLFRVVVPRNRFLAHRLPWSESRRWEAGGWRSGSPLVLCYHAVSPDWPADLAVTPERFREQLEYLLRKGYRAATFGQMIRGEAPAKAMVVTFDDALGSVRDRALPVLRELGIPATVFVPTAYVDRPPPMAWPGTAQWVGGAHEAELTCMSWDDLRGLAAEGWEVASHSCTHPRLTEIDDEELRYELAVSREDCAREIGAPCESLAYPYGAHDERVRTATQEAGYMAAAALELGSRDALRWPRVGVYSKDDLRRFRLKVSPLVRAVLSSSAMRRVRR